MISGNNKPKLIIFTAPSGAGKTTIVQRLLQKDNRLAFSVSACTRQKRDYEAHGKHYYFLTEEAFREKVKNGEFLEWEEVYPGIFYGTLASEIERLTNEGKAVLFDIDVKGAMRIKEKFGNSALTIFVKPPSPETLKERLKGRMSETDASLTKRLERAQYELTFADKFDRVVVNDDLEKAIREAGKLLATFLNNNK